MLRRWIRPSIPAWISTPTPAADGRRRIPFRPTRLRGACTAKLYQDNLQFLRGILEEAAAAKTPRNKVTQEIGDFYGACMDESAVNRRGVGAIQPQLDAIAAMKSIEGYCTADGACYFAIWADTAVRSRFHAGS